MSREPGESAVGAVERDAAGACLDPGQAAGVAESALGSAGEIAALGGAIGPSDGHGLVGQSRHAAKLCVNIRSRQSHSYDNASIGETVYPYAMTETLPDRVQQRLEALNLSPYAASMKASDGRSKDMVSNLLKGRSTNPRGDTLQMIASALETSVDWLLHGDGAAPVPALSKAPASNVRISQLRYPTRRAAGIEGPRDLPVMGTAAGSLGKGAFRIEGGVIDYVIRPDILQNVKDAYGIYVEGDSMDPAHPHGELRIIHPHRPCQIGDTVVLVASYSENGPHEAWIKRLVKRTGEKLIVEQYNPKATIEFDRRFVLSCHKVLTMNDLLGI